MSSTGRSRVFGDALSGISVQVDRLPTDYSYRYITIAGKSAMDSMLSNILLGKAPAQSISISDSVDLSQNKALSGDYLIATFGSNLTSIVISGLDIYGVFGECFTGRGPSVLDFYNRYNAYMNKDGRVILSIASSTDASVFVCVLVSCNCTADHQTPGVGQYKIQLLGVKAV